jgi:cyclohexanecarboxylate-CoA ligase
MWMAIEIEPSSSLWELLVARADATPDDLHAIDTTGRTLTFGGLRDAAQSTAVALYDRGLRGGDVVSWTLPTCLEAPILTCALDRLGVVQNPLIPQLRAREVGFITNQLGSQWLLTPSSPNADDATTSSTFDHAAMARDLATRSGGHLGAVELGRPELLAPTASSASDLPERVGVEPCWALYTSGTSGDPKGVRHTHRSVMAATLHMCSRMEIDEHDRTALAFPFTHVGGINFLMASLLTRCQLLVVESFAAPDTMGFLSRQEMTLGGVTTAFHLAYLAAQRAQPDTPLFPKVRAYPGGGAPKPPVLHYDLVAEVGGVGIIAGYGLTEMPMITMASIHDPTDKLAHTEGRPSSGNLVRILDREGNAVPVGTDGEICAKGPSMLADFVDPALREGAIDADGFLHTGDLGHLDTEGYVTVTGRLKDVIIRKAENISARELEDVLHTHPAVGEVAVIGVPDAERGEMVCAVVVPADSSTPPNLTMLCDHLRANEIMVQKFPERLELVDALPRSDTGKIQKNELRARFG